MAQAELHPAKLLCPRRTMRPCLAFEAFVGRAAWRRPPAHVISAGKRRPELAGPLWAAARDMCWTRAFQA